MKLETIDRMRKIMKNLHYRKGAVHILDPQRLLVLTGNVYGRILC